MHKPKIVVGNTPSNGMLAAAVALLVAGSTGRPIGFTGIGRAVKSVVGLGGQSAYGANGPKPCARRRRQLKKGMIYNSYDFLDGKWQNCHKYYTEQRANASR